MIMWGTKNLTLTELKLKAWVQTIFLGGKLDLTFDLELNRKQPAKSKPCIVCWLSLNFTPSK